MKIYFYHYHQKPFQTTWKERERLVADEVRAGCHRLTNIDIVDKSLSRATQNSKDKSR
jgi:hypothetical protein